MKDVDLSSSPTCTYDGCQEWVLQRMSNRSSSDVKVRSRYYDSDLAKIPVQLFDPIPENPYQEQASNTHREKKGQLASEKSIGRLGEILSEGSYAPVELLERSPFGSAIDEMGNFISSSRNRATRSFSFGGFC
ncbi:hypothetical protein GUITHDRAFT_152428 [Guillardia theta CCMP2712]|uniref:Uncharacterized protein n=2 Tax=Guillardia theta TaxID=55529 RepID=L1JCG0_GUITC|nr:hypothetical protein GUITHDRAFT_152428 [Guillardia theta CCMP2712]EKX46233.1 hypothetical protein GUITHDRAFT_152428 [Guillardia theta CCMP2712]|eukprot:XP_005833213.1 hypothetical protein GUITHDRAFT_152428 [Guillardia theta CCMP2712]